MTRLLSIPGPRAISGVALSAVALVLSMGLSHRAVSTHVASHGGLVVLPDPALLRAPDTATRPRATAASDSVLREEAPTYIAAMLVERDSVLERWRDRSRHPIRVWIDSPGAEHPDFIAPVRSAFDDWGSVGLPVRFVFVDHLADAEVSIRWTPQLVHKTGNTEWRADRDGWIEGANIVLATHLSDGRALDVHSLHAIALHEIGHVLGLGHSDNIEDVMAPLVRVAALSPSDRATARLLYTLPAGRVR